MFGGQAVVGVVLLAALTGCTGAGPASVQVPEVEATTSTWTTATSSTATTPAETTTMSPAEQAVVDLGVRYADVLELPGLGVLLAATPNLDRDPWPREPVSLYQDPPGSCEGPLPLDYGPLTPVVQIKYASEAFTSAEIFAMPVDNFWVDAIEDAWQAHVTRCTRDVTEGPYQTSYLIEFLAGRPVVAARLETDRTLIPTYPPESPDPPVVNTARWIAVHEGLLYVVSVAGIAPVDALRGLKGLVDGIYGPPRS